MDIGKAITLGVPDALVSGMVSGNGGFLQDPAADRGLRSSQASISGVIPAIRASQSAAYLHLCAATPWIRRPSQSLFHMQSLDVIEEGPFRIAEQSV